MLIVKFHRLSLLESLLRARDLSYEVLGSTHQFCQKIRLEISLQWSVFKGIIVQVLFTI